MASKSCFAVWSSIRSIKSAHSVGSSNNQLEAAENQLWSVARFLEELEKHYPENGISAQLRPLFTEALDGFSEIRCLMNDHGQTNDTFRRMLKMIKLENIAEQIRGSMLSGSSSQITIRITEVLQIIKLENIAKQLKTSKPSRSSSRITMEMVEFVRHLLSGVCDVLFFVQCDTEHNAPFIPTVEVLRKKMQSLKGFLMFTANRCIEHEKMNDLFTHTEDVAYTAAYLSFLCLDEELARLLGCEISELLDSINPIRPKVRQIYISVLKASRSSRSGTGEMATIVLEFISSVQEDLEELLSHDNCLKVAFNDRFQWLQEGLSYLTKPKTCTAALLLVEALGIEAGIAIYSLYDEEIDKSTEVDYVLFPLQVKFDHGKVELCVIELLDSEGTMIAPLKNLIHYVQEELNFTRTFLLDLLEQCKEQTNAIELLTLVQSVTSEAWSAIDYLYCGSEQEDLEEINLLHFQLFLKFKFVKAAIRQMYPMIYASSTPDHPMVNLLNFLPMNFEVIDSYSSMKGTTQMSSLGSGKIDEVVVGFIECILEKLSEILKDESDYTVTNEVKKFYHGVLLVVTFVVDPPIQYIECKKQNDFLTEIENFSIEAEAAIRSSYEDDVDYNRSSSTSLVLQLLIVVFKLIKCEGNLMDPLKHKSTDLEAQLQQLMENALEELIFLRAFLMDILRQHKELNKLDDLVMSAEVTAHKATLISCSRYESLMDGSSTGEMSHLLSDFLREMESVKVEVREVCFHVLEASPCNMADGEGLINFFLNNQERVLDSDADSISFLKNQIPDVKDKLACLGSFLADIVQYRDMHQELKDLAEHVVNMKYVCFFPVKGCRPDWYYMLYLSDVKQVIKCVEAEVEVICRKVPDSSSYRFPKTNVLGFIKCFLIKLEELLCSELDTVTSLKLQIGSVKEGLLPLRSLVDNFTENYDEDDENYGFVTSVTETAYKAEYVIDSCLACSHPLWYKDLWISEVVENINSVNRAVRETFERKEMDLAVHKVRKMSTNVVLSLSANAPEANEEMEGFQEAMDKIKKQLHEQSLELDVISIVGMPGIGKSTLAEKIYNDEKDTSHFDVLAKCHVTQVYSWRELLLTIMNDILGSSDRTEKEDGELAVALRQFLLNKRFLILIDDVWDKKVWDLFKMCFDGANKGSRVILTTRLSEVASHAKLKTNPHFLRLYTDDESWMLLQEDVFQGKSCPPELENVGFGIAKSCGGLPLFIVLVAGVLKTKEKKADLWKKVEESIVSKDIGSLEETMSIIEFSYRNLPHPLKPCFLYFGGFLKGKDIHVRKLTRLWLAEQFVEANNVKGPEAAAQDFLRDLVSRNLVMDMEEKPNGKVKTCRIHDLLHTFCLKKAQQENFLLQINSGDDMSKKPDQYRLFIHSDEDQIDLWQPSSSNVRTLLLNATDPDNLLWPHDISFIFDSFKLVKVLDLESFNIGGTFPSGIQSLIHLRYFAAQTEANSIPSSIAALWNLETFVVRRFGGEVMLPSSLLKMARLRHIHVNDRASFSLHENVSESFDNSQLPNLETFSSPHLSYGEDAEKILRKMPNLRKLSCIFSGTFGNSKEDKRKCVLFPRLEFLSRLESLEVVSNSYPAKLPHKFDFPLKLRQLTLSKFRLPWTQISTIGELRNLEILKLLLRAFEGDQWEVEDLAFPELKYLKMDNLNIKQLSLSDYAFPKLEHLVLTKCKRLKEIPSHFDDETPLKSIAINWCSEGLADSAKIIQTNQHEVLGNHAFKVTVLSGLQ